MRPHGPLSARLGLISSVLLLFFPYVAQGHLISSNFLFVDSFIDSLYNVANTPAG